MAESKLENWQDAVDAAVELIEENGRSISILDQTSHGSGIGQIDFQKSNNYVVENILAAVLTPTGVTVFDGASVERVVTHVFYIEYINYEIDSQKFIEFDGGIYSIIAVVNIGELNGVFKISCEYKGPIELEGAF